MAAHISFDLLWTIANGPRRWEPGDTTAHRSACNWEFHPPTLITLDYTSGELIQDASAATCPNCLVMLDAVLEAPSGVDNNQYWAERPSSFLDILNPPP